MVGIRLFPIGIRPIFRGKLAVSFREGRPSQSPKRKFHPLPVPSVASGAMSMLVSGRVISFSEATISVDSSFFMVLDFQGMFSLVAPTHNHNLNQPSRPGIPCSVSETNHVIYIYINVVLHMYASQFSMSIIQPR